MGTDIRASFMLDRSIRSSDLSICIFCPNGQPCGTASRMLHVFGLALSRADGFVASAASARRDNVYLPCFLTALLRSLEKDKLAEHRYFNRVLFRLRQLYVPSYSIIITPYLQSLMIGVKRSGQFSIFDLQIHYLNTEREIAALDIQKPLLQSPRANRRLRFF